MRPGSFESAPGDDERIRAHARASSRSTQETLRRRELESCVSKHVKATQQVRATFSFNLRRNIVALQVERVVARITTACSTFHATNFSVAGVLQVSAICCAKVDPSCTFCNNFFQLATLKFVAWKVMIRRATTSLTCNATMLCDKVERKCFPYYLAGFTVIFNATRPSKSKLSGNRSRYLRLSRLCSSWLAHYVPRSCNFPLIFHSSSLETSGI